MTGHASNADGTGEATNRDAFARSTTRMSLLTVVSRATGFVRVIVVAAVLGTSYLGNTYQSANTVPNILFELLAAGALQAVLVPSMVELLDAGKNDDAEEVAGSVLGIVAALLAGVAAAGIVAAPWIMRILTAAVDDPSIRAEEIALGQFFLWFFLPQVVLYAANMVATAVLNAKHHFALPVFAPVVNNVVVIGTYVLFWFMREGQEPTLDLSFAEKAVLAGGTTLGVLAFCAVPVIGVWRTGFRLLPKLNHRHPGVRRLGRLGAWAVVFLAMTQVLLIVVLLLANGVEGGVVVYQVAFVMFMLPHSLFSVPVMTTLFPNLSRQAHRREWAEYGATVVQGLRSIGFFTLPAAALTMALAPLLAQVIIFGAASGRVSAVAAAMAAFAPGVVGFGALLFLTRAFYAVDDARTPALVNIGVAVTGSIAMTVSFSLLPEADKVTGLAASYSLGMLLGAITLLGLLRWMVLAERARLSGLWPSLLRRLGAAALAGVGVHLVSVAVPDTGRVSALLQLLVLTAVGVAIYLLLQWILGGTPPREALRYLGSTERGDPEVNAVSISATCGQEPTTHEQLEDAVPADEMERR